MRRVHAVFLHRGDDLHLVELGDLVDLGKAGLELIEHGLAESEHLFTHTERQIHFISVHFSSSGVSGNATPLHRKINRSG